MCVAFVVSRVNFVVHWASAVAARGVFERFSHFGLRVRCRLLLTFAVFGVLLWSAAKTALIEASVDTVALIHQSEPAGDILLFLTGQEEIDKTCKELRAWAEDYDRRLRRQGAQAAAYALHRTGCG